MTEPTSISIAADFSPTPGSRYRIEGPYSGQQFLEEILERRYLAARQTGCSLVVDFDGAEGYATSFLDGSFGELARKYEPAEVLSTLELKSTIDPFLADEVSEYIREARTGKYR